MAEMSDQYIGVDVRGVTDKFAVDLRAAEAMAKAQAMKIEQAAQVRLNVLNPDANAAVRNRDAMMKMLGQGDLEKDRIIQPMRALQEEARTTLGGIGTSGIAAVDSVFDRAHHRMRELQRALHVITGGFILEGVLGIGTGITKALHGDFAGAAAAAESVPILGSLAKSAREFYEAIAGSAEEMKRVQEAFEATSDAMRSARGDFESSIGKQGLTARQSRDVTMLRTAGRSYAADQLEIQQQFQNALNEAEESFNNAKTSSQKKMIEEFSKSISAPLDTIMKQFHDIEDRVKSLKDEHPGEVPTGKYNKITGDAVYRYRSQDEIDSQIAGLLADPVYVGVKRALDAQDKSFGKNGAATNALNSTITDLQSLRDAQMAALRAHPVIDTIQSALGAFRINAARPPASEDEQKNTTKAIDRLYNLIRSGTIPFVAPG